MVREENVFMLVHLRDRGLGEIKKGEKIEEILCLKTDLWARELKYNTEIELGDKEGHRF